MGYSPVWACTLVLSICCALV